MYTREEGFYGLPRPLRADIQLWIHLVRTCIECNYFNFIAAIEKEIKQKPRNFTEAFIFCFFVSYCFLRYFFLHFLSLLYWQCMLLHVIFGILNHSFLIVVCVPLYVYQAVCRFRLAAKCCHLQYAEFFIQKNTNAAAYNSGI